MYYFMMLYECNLKGKINIFQLLTLITWGENYWVGQKVCSGSHKMLLKSPKETLANPLLWRKC